MTLLLEALAIFFPPQAKFGQKVFFIVAFLESWSSMVCKMSLLCSICHCKWPIYGLFVCTEIFFFRSHEHRSSILNSLVINFRLVTHLCSFTSITPAPSQFSSLKRCFPSIIGIHRLFLSFFMCVYLACVCACIHICVCARVHVCVCEETHYDSIHDLWAHSGEQNTQLQAKKGMITAAINYTLI